MYDIDKDLDEIRSIDVSPSSELICDAKETIMHEEDELHQRRKRAKKSNAGRFIRILTVPAAAAAALIIFINLAISTPVSHYSIDINPNITFDVDENGIVSSIDDIELAMSKDEIIGKPLEYAISRVIIQANNDGYIKDSEHILIGAFGDDEHNNVSKNQVLSYLDDSLRESIVLLSINGSIDDWNAANKEDISAGLYLLNNIAGGIKITKNNTLDELILSIQNTHSKDIQVFLEENKEPIIYRAPSLTYKPSGDYIIFSWEPIEYKKYNYDGYITYQLISAESPDKLLTSPTIVDELTFASWDLQPTDYTHLIGKDNAHRYYAIVTNYDDGKRLVDGNYTIVESSN